MSVKLGSDNMAIPYDVAPFSCKLSKYRTTCTNFHMAITIYIRQIMESKHNNLNYDLGFTKVAQHIAHTN